MSMSGNDSDQWGPPSRHRADDDLEALATGSFASVRTPNGPTDLLDDAFGAGDDAHYTAPPEADTSKFSIDGECDDDDGEGSAKQSEVTASSSAVISEGQLPSEREVKLAERTTQIMSDYRAYLSEMGPVIPANSPAERGAVPTQRGGVSFSDYPEYDETNTFPTSVVREGDETSRVSSLESGGVSVALQRGWAYSGVVHDVPLGAIDEADDLDDIREELGLRTRRKYTHPIFHSKKFKRTVLGVILACVVIGTVAGVTTAVTKARREKNLPDWEEELAEVQKEEEQASLPQEEWEPGNLPGGIEPIPPPEVELEPEILDLPDLPGTKVTTEVILTKSPVNPPTRKPTRRPTEAPTKATKPPTNKPTKATNSPTTKLPSNYDDFELAMKYESINEEFHPMWFDRDSDWNGTSYLEALEFCATHNSFIPCPYEAYCPAGKNELPLGGLKDEPKGTWAPIINSPNEWVQVGGTDTCLKYTAVNGQPPLWGLTGKDNEEITRHLMCCREPPPVQADEDSGASVADNEGPSGNSGASANGSSGVTQDPYTGPGAPPPLTDSEQDVLDNLHPIWFGRQNGYSGTTHDEAIEFCKNINGMHLCPIDAYCPNGPLVDGKPLFLRMDAFEGEQWAPVIDPPNGWVLIGIRNQNPASTCLTHMDLFSKQPLWGLDGTNKKLKQHVMCCADPSLVSGGLASDTGPSNGGGNSDSSVSKPESKPDTNDGETDQDALEHAMVNKLQPVWLDKSHGWKGGSHDDAALFCQNHANKTLCPYAAYCPRGKGQAVLGGHSTDFNVEGEQWAPLYGIENTWVMIGRKHDNSATTCMTHTQLEGSLPDWGLDDSRPEVKKHLMCCHLD